MTYVVLARCLECNAVIARGKANNRKERPQFDAIKQECTHTSWMVEGCLFEWIPVGAHEINLRMRS